MGFRSSFLLFITFTAVIVSCGEGGKKLEKSPKTHVRKPPKGDMERITVYRVENTWNKAVQLRNLSIKPELIGSDLRGGSVFELGMHFEDAVVLLESPKKLKQKELTFNLLNDLRETLEDLGISGRELEESLNSGQLPDQDFLKDLYVKSECALQEKGGQKQVMIMRIGNWIEHLYLFLVSKESGVPAKQRVFLEQNRVIGQHLLLSLVETVNQEAVNDLIGDLSKLMSCFDKFSRNVDPVNVKKGPKDEYLITGGVGIETDSHNLEELKNAVMSIRNSK